MKKLLLIVNLCVLMHWAYAQQSIKGTVVDETGEGIPGVSIIAEGTTNGTVSDINGNYQMSLKEGQTKLTYSFLGYIKQAIEVNGRSIINVNLQPDVEQLEEVIVVGYGTMRKSDVTGSIASVSADENVARQYTTVDQILKGRAAGVQVTSNSANPGMGVSVKIRGISSLRGNNEPLYVIDGIIMDSAGEDAVSASTDGNASQESQNGLNGINPRDIASIEVLKDASATAIYGSRGSNGVILITTKKGTKGEMTVNAYATSGVSIINRKLDVLNGVDYAAYNNESNILAGNSVNYHIEGNQVFDIINNNGVSEIATSPNKFVNWQDEIYGTGITTNAGVSFSGGSDNGNYYVSAGYYDQGGIVESSRWQSGDFRLNVTQNLNKKLKVDGRLSGYMAKGNFAQDGDRAGGGNRSFIKNIITFRPIISSEVNNLEEDLETSSPYTWINDYEDVSNELRIVGSLAITYDLPIKGLKYQIRAGGNIRSKERRRFYGLTTFNGQTNNGQLSISNLKATSYTINNLLMYNRTINNQHRVNATVGLTYDGKDTENSLYEVTDFSTTEFTVDGPEYGALVTRPLTTLISSAVIFSYLGRVNYTFKDKYILTASFRADGSSKFADGKKYGYFPSFSMAWRADEEDFIQSLGLFSIFKMRAGWGQTGNQAIFPYQTLQNYNIGFYANESNASNIAFIPSNIANPDLTWETTSQFNVGFDFGFFENRLTANVDLYSKETKDLLQQITLPTSAGFSRMFINRGTITNKGIDLNMDAVIYDKNDLRISFGGNVSFNRNEITKLGIPTNTVWIDGAERQKSFYLGDNISTGSVFKSPGNIFMEGEQIGMFFGFVTNGIYQTEDSDLLSGAIPGDIRIVDQNGDGIIDANDRTIIGNPNPDFVYGFNLSINYKRLTANVLMNGVSGNEIINGNSLTYDIADGSARNIRPAAYHNAWRPDAQSATHPRIRYNKENGAVAITDRIVENGSYFRISNVTLGYDLPLEKVFQRSHLYVSAQNLLTITGYSGYEPEITSFLNNGNIQGVDWNGFPNVRTFLVGLNINF